jgi:hypothetical protein
MQYQWIIPKWNEKIFSIYNSTEKKKYTREVYNLYSEKPQIISEGSWEA